MAENAETCYERIRYTLSDAGGDLRFTSFRIVGGAERQGVEEELRDYLLSRPLRQIELETIARLSCPYGRQCIETVAKVVAEQQGLFAGEEKEEEAGDA